MRLRSDFLIVIVLVGLALVGLGWWRLRRPVAPVPIGDDSTKEAAAYAPAPPSAHGPPAGNPPRQVAADHARRDELRARILAALASAPATAVAQSPPPRSTGDVAPRPPGNLTDRIGGRAALAKQLNHDFMPLADECIERAQDQKPALAGMLVLRIETVAEQELGAVVERAETAPNSTVTDADLLECIRETALSLRLPPPPESGREKFELSLRVEPRPAPNSQGQGQNRK